MHPWWFFSTTEIRAKVHLNTSQSHITTQAIDVKNYSTVKPVLRGHLWDKEIVAF
jgi:hypothetical protein